MPADMSKYPADWPEIRSRILRRAGGWEHDPRIGARCEKCELANYSVVQRYDADKVFCEDDDGRGFLSYEDARRCADILNDNIDENEPRYIVIVLTIAHVHDPDPSNCDDDNLAAWCQRCHNRHDVQMRKRNAAKTRRGKLVESGQGVLL